MNWWHNKSWDYPEEEQVMWECEECGWTGDDAEYVEKYDQYLCPECSCLVDECEDEYGYGEDE